MLKFLGTLADLVERFFKWLDESKLRNEGRQLERRDVAEIVQKETVDAEQIREAVRADAAARPDDILRDDGFRRD